MVETLPQKLARLVIGTGVAGALVAFKAAGGAADDDARLRAGAGTGRAARSLPIDFLRRRVGPASVLINEGQALPVPGRHAPRLSGCDQGKPLLGRSAARNARLPGAEVEHGFQSMANGALFQKAAEHGRGDVAGRVLRADRPRFRR